MKLYLGTPRHHLAWLSIERTETIIRIYARDTATAIRLGPLVLTWCSSGAGAADQRLQFRTSGCGCDDSKVRYWTFPRSMIEEYGPLPFTADGKEIRWRWWHFFGDHGRFDVGGTTPRYREPVGWALAVSGVNRTWSLTTAQGTCVGYAPRCLTALISMAARRTYTPE